MKTKPFTDLTTVINDILHAFSDLENNKDRKFFCHHIVG
jgi:hypothetical protein